VYVLHLWLAKRAVIKRLVKILFFEKKTYRLVMYTTSRIFGLLGGTRGPFLVVAAMVMWVLLAIGRLPLVAWCICWHKSYIIVGIA
jgi:hypothetical protein